MTMAKTPPPTFADLRTAASRIAEHVHRTPLVTSTTLNRELGLAAYFKCENLQKVGAFKARGALNAVLSLDDEAAGRGLSPIRPVTTDRPLHMQPWYAASRAPS